MTDHSEMAALTPACAWALDATEDSLASLRTASPSVKNSYQVYGKLVLATGDKATRVVEYIREQCTQEDDVLLMAVKALEVINTHDAEILIKDIALTTPKTSQHTKYIGAECIASLQNMGTETAADFILELGRSGNDLVWQSIHSLQMMYDSNQDMFRSQYAQMLRFATKRETLLHIQEKAFDVDDEAALRVAFKNADERQVLPKAGFCETAFELAVRQADLLRALKEVESQWQDLAQDGPPVS